MDEAQPDPHPLQRNVMLVLLLALAAAAWAVLVWEHHSVAMDMAMSSPDMGMRAPLVLAIWVVVMMVAMMFPTAAPMILAYHEVQAGKHYLGDAFVSTWVFVASYLLVWVSVGFAVYAVVLAAEASVLRGSLPAHPVQGGMPRTVSHAHPLHYDVMARRDGRCISYGLASWALLSGLLLDALRHSLSARHERWSDGSCRSHHIG